MSWQTFVVTVNEMESGTSEIWVAGSEDELFEMLEGSLSIATGNRGLFAAQAIALYDLLNDEELGSYEAAEQIWGCVHDLGEFDGNHFVVSFNIRD